MHTFHTTCNYVSLESSCSRVVQTWNPDVNTCHTFYNKDDDHNGHCGCHVCADVERAMDRRDDAAREGGVWRWSVSTKQTSLCCRRSMLSWNLCSHAWASGRKRVSFGITQVDFLLGLGLARCSTYPYGIIPLCTYVGGRCDIRDTIPLYTWVYRS